MIDKYLLKYNSSTLGILLIDYENDSYKFVSNKGYNGPLPFLHNDSSSTPIEESVKLWVFSRCMDYGRETIEDLVKSVNFRLSDPYEYFRQNFGRSVSDKFYVEPLIMVMKDAKRMIMEA